MSVSRGPLVTMIHTVPTVYASFPELVKQAIPEVRVVNTVDEFLASDPGERGEFTITNRSRFLRILETAQMTGAAAIVTTCSTLSPEVELLRPLIGCPIVTIDGAMLREAVALGTRIVVIATASSTIGPTTSMLATEAERAGKTVDVATILCPEAYTAIKARDAETHDRIVLDRANEAGGADVVVLAQASMAHLEAQVREMLGIPVLSSPSRCVRELADVVQRGSHDTTAATSPAARR